MRRLTLTEEQFEAVKEALSAWDVYATMKSDDAVDPDEIGEHIECFHPELAEGSQEWFDKYEELEQAEVTRFNNIGGSMKEVLDMIVDDDKHHIGQGPNKEDEESERLYFKYRDSIDRDWSTIGVWMYEAVPDTTSEIEEEILQAEYGLSYDQIDELEMEEPSDLPFEETWEFKRLVVSNAVGNMLKDSLY